MSEWPRRELGDLCDRITVGHVGPMTTEYVSRGVTFLRSLNVKRGRLNLEGVKYISHEFNMHLGKSQLLSGDLVIVRTGEPGATALIPNDFGPANCSDLVIARPRAGVSGQFLCYAINETAREFVRAHTVGAVQQHFNVASAKKLVISLPDLAEQQAIAAVLGALDDKIAVNERIATMTEALAIALASEALWDKRAILSHLCELRREQVSPQDLPNSTVAHYSLPAYDTGKMAELVSPDVIKSNKFLLQVPSVLLSKLNPEIPRVWEVEPQADIPALASTEFLVLSPRSGFSTHEIWAVTSQAGFLARLAGKVTGTSKSHQRVRPADVLSAEVVDPRAFGQVRQQISSLSIRSSLARKESATLAALRDTLLPKLMSGQLTVKQAETLAQDVA